MKKTASNKTASTTKRCALCKYPQKKLAVVSDRLVCANQVECRMTRASELQPDLNLGGNRAAVAKRQKLQKLCDRYEAAYTALCENVTVAALQREMRAFAALESAAKTG